MKIAVLSDTTMTTPHPAGHGLGRAASDIATRLLRAGHDVTLFAKRDSRFAGSLVTVDASGYGGEWRLAKAAYQSHQTERFDALLDNGHLHCLAQLFPDLPVVNVFHDNYQAWQRNAVLLSYGQQAQIVTQDPRFATARVIHNALDSPQYPPSFTPGTYALFLGAIADLKQPLLAIEACARLDIPLVMAGSPVNGAILPVTPGCNVQQVGAVTSPYKEALLRGARVFLQLSAVESFGLTTLEAGLSGTPVVAYATGGSVDLVRYGRNGVFIQPSGNRVQAVCNAIERAWYMDRQLVHDTTLALNNPAKQVAAYEDALLDVICGRMW